MYSYFQSKYYSEEEEPLLSRGKFPNYAPLIIIKTGSRQSELLKIGTVDVCLEF